MVQIEAREVGVGRTTRQPGQVRKEAALTRLGGSLSSLPLGSAATLSLRPVSGGTPCFIAANVIVALGARYSRSHGTTRKRP
jgi:hypothetical protein